MTPLAEMIEFPRLEGILNWLLNHSLQAGILVLLVLLVQWLFRRRITHRWRFALWWLVLARLLLPFGPESAVSVFNFVHPRVTVESPRYYLPVSAAMPAEHKTTATPVASPPLPMDESVSAKNDFSTTGATAATLAPTPATKATAVVEPAAGWRGWKISEWDFDDWMVPGALILWAAGVLGLGGIVGGQILLFQRKLRRDSVPADENLSGLLEECRREFGVFRRIELRETDAVQSPALYGLFRLRLLLPRGLAKKFSTAELRYIFLHELGHVKRGDLWLNWLVTGLQIVHWFNPLVWFGFGRLRADRELACDELVLLRAGDHTGIAYGKTVIKLLENLNRPAAIPGLIGILEDKQQMRRRIAMIAGFHKPGRWSVLALFLILGLGAAALTDAQTDKSPAASSNVSQNESAAMRPDLKGSVVIKGGANLPVPATVFIATAAPKSGSSTFCPSCYADCIKHARTDARGEFKIGSLDPQLTFQILVVAKGFKPKSVSKVDPAKDGPVKIELEPIESAAAASDQSLRGRVVDPKGMPIEGAVVDVQGIETADGGGSWGSLPGIDPMAVTDEKGEFLITSRKPFAMMAVKISARMFASQQFAKLASGATVHDLVLAEGAALTGRVLSQGRPLPGVSVGVCGVDRSTGHFVGHFEIGTGAQGEFTFLNLPPDTDYYLYGTMDTLKNFGVIPVQTIHVGGNGETIKAGDLVVGPAQRLAGQVVLADGKPVPPKTRLLVSREQAWDSLQIVLGPDGRFDTAGIPPEIISLSVRVEGYHVAADNRSLDRLNPFELKGRVNADITNLVLKLEKGPSLQPDYGNIGSDYNAARQRPLHGTEGGVDHSREWRISGHAFDRETKQSITRFQVTPGLVGDFNTEWRTLAAVLSTNGGYQIYLSQRVAQPLLLAEAEGYLPATAIPPLADATNVDFYLERGYGPAGTVLNPDGQPAAGTTLVLLNGEFNQAGFNSAGELNARWHKAIQQSTDASGKFSYQPVWGAKTLVAASTNGFAAVSLETLATNRTITLAPYGKISGTLKRASGWGTNEDLDVAFEPTGTLAGLAQINTMNHVKTDVRGRFSFDRLPPGHLRITYRRMMADGRSWQNELLQTVDLLPGQSLVVDIQAADRVKETEVSFDQPSSKPVSGKQLKGFVLLPDGRPAVDADVALQIQGEYLALGKGELFSGTGREKGFVVRTGPDGGFTLPLYEKAQSVIAVNEAGIAQVSMEQFKKSSKIALQKWGRIEGVLHIGHHLGTNEVLEISSAQSNWALNVWSPGQPAALSLPFYDQNSFKAPTDEQGHFVITFVPPGKQQLWRRVPAGTVGWTQNDLVTVEVAAGETVITNVGGDGRTVIGRLKLLPNPAAPSKTEADLATNFTNGFLAITTPTPKLLEKAHDLKNDAERVAFYQTPEVRAALENRRHFSASILPDGSFRFEDVVPGKYVMRFQVRRATEENMPSFRMFASSLELAVPVVKGQNDETLVDWGTIELKELALPQPQMVPSKNK